MEIRRANRTQRFGVRDNSNLTASIKASQASANMYDEMTNSFLKLSDVATTSAINAEIRDSALEGEMKGVEGTRQTEDGAFKGYEKDTEIFKWDVASNKASKASFEAGVSGRASSSMKNLAKEVNGNKEAYETVAKQMLDDSLKNVSDEQQRQHITNSYAKSYNQNMGTVSTKYIQIASKQAKDGWDAGRESFEEDYGVKLQSMERNKRKLREAQLAGDAEFMNYYMDKIEEDGKSLSEFAKARTNKANGALQFGVITTEEVERDVKADIVKAINTSSVQSYRMAETEEDKNRLISEIDRIPDSIMSPKNKASLMNALHDEELQEQKMWKSSVARDDKEYNMDKKVSLDTINLNMLDDNLDEQTLVDLKDALTLGYVNEKEYQDYRNRITNGSPVERDEWSAYTEVVNNVESYSASDIANMNGLTDATKKKFIGDRMTWEEEGNEWMTLPAYRGGKDVIRDAYGFPEKGIMPEFLTKASRDKYTEMNEIQHEYREAIQQAVAKGERYNGMAIAEELMARQKSDVRSSMYGKYVDSKVLRKNDLVNAKKTTGGNLKNILARQYEKFPNTKFSSDIQDVMTQEDKDNPTPKETPTTLEDKLSPVESRKVY